MGKTGWDIDLLEVFSRKPDPDPASEGGRTAADIDRHIEDFSLNGPHQLSLRTPALRMQAPQSAVHRTRMVVLDERCPDAALSILALIIIFQEESPGVPMDIRFYGNDIRNFSRLEPHPSVFLLQHL